eukprot:g81250.t1
MLFGHLDLRSNTLTQSTRTRLDKKSWTTQENNQIVGNIDTFQYVPVKKASKSTRRSDPCHDHRYDHITMLHSLLFLASSSCAANTDKTTEATHREIPSLREAAPYLKGWHRELFHRIKHDNEPGEFLAYKFGMSDKPPAPLTSLTSRFLQRRTMQAKAVVNKGDAPLNTETTLTVNRGTSDDEGYAVYKLARPGNVAYRVEVSQASSCGEYGFVFDAEVDNIASPDNFSPFPATWQNILPDCLIDLYPTTRHMYLVFESGTVTDCTFTFTLAQKADSCMKIAIGNGAVGKVLVGPNETKWLEFTSTETSGQLKTLHWEAEGGSDVNVATFAGGEDAYYSFNNDIKTVAMVPNYKAIWGFYNANANNA